MQLQINATVTKPSKTNPPLLESVGITEQVVEDVAGFIFTEDGILVHFNQGEKKMIPFRSNNTTGGEDWRAVNIFVTRKFLKIDMSK